MLPPQMLNYNRLQNFISIYICYEGRHGRYLPYDLSFYSYDINYIGANYDKKYNLIGSINIINGYVLLVLGKINRNFIVTWYPGCLIFAWILKQ